ncbi:MAG TPA: DNRLRE domain-containing protein, partial [Aggregatilineales bacterium]|nr:DNRLRE domain-containing protein [Aggregatilineales bacterium]
RSALVSAMLRLKVEDSSRDELTLSIVDGGWQGDELTYDRRPPEGTAIATVGGGREGGWLQVDIAGTIWQASGDELTIAVASEGSDGIDFTSSEAVVDQPHLVLVLED